MGYFGSVVLLLIVYLGFISGDGDTRGLLGMPVADGQNVRAAMLLAAAWFALFALPVFIVVPHSDARARATGGRASASSAPTASCGATSSASGAATTTSSTTCSPARCSATAWPGVFAFGAVLGVSVYGISNADVLLFGVSASVIAAVGAVLGGLVDDRFGSKPVIVGSLASMIASALILC